MTHDRIYLACQLTAGAFSGEAIFEVTTQDGNTYTGIVPRRDCRLEPFPVVSSENPSQEKKEGKIAARLISEEGDFARVALPDGEAIFVSKEKISEREREKDYVSL